ncbi:uncharacterized protein J4E79_000766 [Alternaria viburni]|uniref:uncharacterized protein n=1 Tax=Alternaria viburni TaxID=566460 RepID=UPI0020C261E9|nr:uncharacterized protein J4E79_000766 [Alternaria viburni]KAI4670484.1 hypothetical protein J4E79_000766 [Alternaria viburni]
MIRKTRGLPVIVLGLTLFIYDLQPGILTILHERPNRKPMVYVLDGKDFEDSADEVFDDTTTEMRSSLELSAVGLGLRLIKNDGMLKVNYQGENGGVVDWTFQGLRCSSVGSMTACAFTQTMPEVAVQSELSNSTIQTVSTDPILERIVQPPVSGLSIISTTETRPVKPIVKPMIKPAITTKFPKEEPGIFSSMVDKESGLKRKATEDVEQPKPHKLAKTSHESPPPWPAHLYMTCCRMQPVSQSPTGNLHIDLREGTVWFEGWHGKAEARIFEKRQVNLRDSSEQRPTSRPPSSSMRSSTALTVLQNVHPYTTRTLIMSYRKI